MLNDIEKELAKIDETSNDPGRVVYNLPRLCIRQL